jgi:hypothetical protein
MVRFRVSATSRKEGHRRFASISRLDSVNDRPGFWVEKASLDGRRCLRVKVAGCKLVEAWLEIAGSALQALNVLLLEAERWW